MPRSWFIIFCCRCQHKSKKKRERPRGGDVDGIASSPHRPTRSDINRLGRLISEKAPYLSYFRTSTLVRRSGLNLSELSLPSGFSFAKASQVWTLISDSCRLVGWPSSFVFVNLTCAGTLLSTNLHHVFRRLRTERDH